MVAVPAPACGNGFSVSPQLKENRSGGSNSLISISTAYSAPSESCTMVSSNRPPGRRSMLIDSSGVVKPRGLGPGLEHQVPRRLEDACDGELAMDQVRHRAVLSEGLGDARQGGRSR